MGRRAAWNAMRLWMVGDEPLVEGTDVRYLAYNDDGDVVDEFMDEDDLADSGLSLGMNEDEGILVLIVEVE